LARAVYFDEPPIAKRLFATITFAWLWLVLRLYLGWEWFVSGWGKTFGGQLTLEFWRWGQSQYSVTGTANCGWIPRLRGQRQEHPSWERPAGLCRLRRPPSTNRG
jgi:hypothetical protein